MMMFLTQHKIATHKHTSSSFSMYFFITFRAAAVRSQLHVARSAAAHWSEFLLYVGASEALLRN